MTETRVRDGIGTDAARPDGVHKVRGEFAYSSDMWLDNMLWGATLRSPHPRARIVGIDITAAIKTPGVHAVLTSDDVPGRNRYGLEIPDQPVLAETEVRYEGEPVAVVAADHPEIARQACKKIAVTYEVLPPITDAVEAIESNSPHVHEPAVPGHGIVGNVLRHVHIERGAQNVDAPIVVKGEYEIGMQDQAFLGPESGLAVPADDGGVELFVATQWLHADREQVAVALDLPKEQVRFTLAGVGGAFGGREDVSMQAHACLLALRTNRPIKMVYSREESFYGHVHRHPAILRYEHGAGPDGRLIYVRAAIVLDGGAYASSSTAVAANAATLGFGPYVVPNLTMDCRVAYTNNPPCGAMRGFGAVQACFAYESQMDRLAEACALDPVEVRVRNALREGSVMPTGQVVDSAAPVAELLRRVSSVPLPPLPDGERDVLDLPGGASNATHGESVRRGIGYGIGIKNVGFSEGFDDFSTARVRVELVNGEPIASVQTAAAEVGQGLVTVIQQIVRTELGVEQVTLIPPDTSIDSAGSTSASRQTYVTGGAVQAACLAVRARMDSHGLVEPIDETVLWRHRPTVGLDPVTGQGNAHVQYAFAAHRAVVDVDTELGLVKVVEITTAQDVGRAMNPQAVAGQIHGGTAQGLGLALMEEIQIVGGVLKNPSFTDYLLPTILDMPPMNVDVLELADPNAPYGLRGVGEPPTISSTPAIVAAIRAATGVPLRRVPVRPEHITGTATVLAARGDI
jgi:CO/xanthine dehydrogenase Mo-binding subunit